MLEDCKFYSELTEIHSKNSKKPLGDKKDFTQKNCNNKSPKHIIRPCITNSHQPPKYIQIEHIANEINRKIKRIQNLYDSFGEDESDKEKEEENCGLNPKSIFIDIYDIFCSGFCLFYMPYRLAKTKMVINNDEYFIIAMVNFSEIIYIIDLLFGFFRWFYNNEFKLVSVTYMVIRNYLSNNFIFDLIMAIPLLFNIKI